MHLIQLVYKHFYLYQVHLKQGNDRLLPYLLTQESSRVPYVCCYHFLRFAISLYFLVCCIRKAPHNINNFGNSHCLGFLLPHCIDFIQIDSDVSGSQRYLLHLNNYHSWRVCCNKHCFLLGCLHRHHSQSHHFHQIIGNQLSSC